MTSRRARYILLRVAYATVLLGMLWVVYLGQTAFQSYPPVHMQTVSQIARAAYAFFSSFCVTQVFVALLCGPAIVAASVAQERERRTLEYLFATDLTNREIVLGKFLARFLQFSMLLLVGLPILSLLMMLGGVPPLQLALVFLLTVSTLAWVTALSILVSVFSASPRRAVVRAYILLFVLLVLPWVLYVFSLFVATALHSWIPYQLFPWLTLSADHVAQLTAYNPVVTLSSILDSDSSSINFVVLAIVQQSAMSVLALVAACWAVRRVHLNARAASSTTERLPRFLRTSRRSVGKHPIRWKELHTAHSRGIVRRVGVFGSVVFILLITAIIFMTAVVTWANATRSPYIQLIDYYAQVGLMMAIVCSGWLLIVGAQASGSISGERDRDTWLTLISTTVEAREVITGKLLGAIRSLPLMCLLIVAAWVPGVFFANSDFLLLIATVALPILTLTILTLATAMIGVTCSLVSKNSTRSLGITLVILVLIGGGYLFCCMPLLIAMSPSSPEEMILAPAIPFLLAFWWFEVGKFSGPAFTAACLGLTFYASIAAILYGYCIINFDSLAGRSTPPLDRSPEAQALGPAKPKQSATPPAPTDT